jgi:hypothetical protein
MTQLIINSPHASNVKPLIQAALEHEIRLLQMGIEKTKRRLHNFEKLFKMETLHFYQAFQNGDMGDEMEYMKWAGEYETLLQLEDDYAQIKGVQVC